MGRSARQVLHHIFVVLLWSIKDNVLCHSQVTDKTYSLPEPILHKYQSTETSDTLAPKLTNTIFTVAAENGLSPEDVLVSQSKSTWPQTLSPIPSIQEINALMLNSKIPKATPNDPFLGPLTLTRSCPQTIDNVMKPPEFSNTVSTSVQQSLAPSKPFLVTPIFNLPSFKSEGLMSGFVPRFMSNQPIYNSSFKNPKIKSLGESVEVNRIQYKSIPANDEIISSLVVQTPYSEIEECAFVPYNVEINLPIRSKALASGSDSGYQLPDTPPQQISATPQFESFPPLLPPIIIQKSSSKSNGLLLAILLRELILRKNANGKKCCKNCKNVALPPKRRPRKPKKNRKDDDIEPPDYKHYSSET